MTEEAVRAALATVEDPEIHRPITDLGMVRAVRVEGKHAVVEILLTISGCPMRGRINDSVRAAVLGVDGIETVDVVLDVMNDEQRTALREKLQGPKREIAFNRPGNTTVVLAVTSGKGGVGKSSVTVNLAVAMAQAGLQVGIVDADIYGHSIPDMLGITDPPSIVGEMQIPPVGYGVKCMSILPFKPQGKHQPVPVRGPMLHRYLESFLSDVYWGDLDVLLLDLPPGTGDIAMSTGALLPNSELLIVTTPQKAAADVAVRAGMLAPMQKQRIAGVIENMSAFACPHCGEPIDLFGFGGGELVANALASETGKAVALLGRIPFDADLRSGGDTGTPIVLAKPDAPAAQALRAIANELANRPRNLVGKSLGLSPRSN